MQTCNKTLHKYTHACTSTSTCTCMTHITRRTYTRMRKYMHVRMHKLHVYTHAYARPCIKLMSARGRPNKQTNEQTIKHTCAHMRQRTHMHYLHKCIHASHKCIDQSMHTCNTRIYKHTCIYIYIYIYIHTYIRCTTHTRISVHARCASTRTHIHS